MVGNGHRLRHQPGHGVGHPLEHDGEAPGGGQGAGVVDQRGGGVDLAALDLEPAHGVHGLRGQADVAHDRDLGVEDGLDHGQALAAPFELDRLGAGPDQAGGVADGVLDAQVVAEPRHVGDDHGVGLDPGHGGDVVGHVVDGDRQGVVVPEDDHGERVADQDHVDRARHWLCGRSARRRP